MKPLRFFLLFTLLLLTSFTFYSYFQNLSYHKKEMERELYYREIEFMKKSIVSAIEEKKRAISAISITLASNKTLFKKSLTHRSVEKQIEMLTQLFRENTDYKNIWIELADATNKILFESWNKKIESKEGCAAMEYAMRAKRVVSSISADEYGLSIKSIAPVFDNKNVLGAVSVIAHFNSIAHHLKKFDMFSLVIANKELSTKITHPFSQHFVEGHYMANLEFPQEIQQYVQEKGLDHIKQQPFLVTQEYLIVNLPLLNRAHQQIGNYIAFKKIATLSKTDVEFFLFRGLVVGLALFALLFIVLLIYIYIKSRSLKRYYKNIIDSTLNILLVYKEKELLWVNRRFFYYFKGYDGVEDFKKQQRCICDFFVQESGCLMKYVDGIYWMDYIQQHPEKQHKAKIELGQKSYYFLITFSNVSAELHHKVMVFSDITEQERAYREIQELSLRDPLTEAGNRRKYMLEIEKEMVRSCRYKEPLSMIMYDIDFFKKINDTYGHGVGDDVLHFYTQLIAKELRESDELFRVGGEEFVILVPHTKKEDAAKLAEKLRKLVEESKHIVPVTMSFGVSEFLFCEDEDSFYNRVDKALYQAKNSGRNRVVVL